MVLDSRVVPVFMLHVVFNTFLPFTNDFNQFIFIMFMHEVILNMDSTTKLVCLISLLKIHFLTQCNK